MVIVLESFGLWYPRLMWGVREVNKLSDPQSKGVLLCFEFKKNGFHPFISKFAMIAASIF